MRLFKSRPGYISYIGDPRAAALDALSKLPPNEDLLEDAYRYVEVASLKGQVRFAHYLSKFGDERSAHTLLRMFQDAESDDVKRAALKSLQKVAGSNDQIKSFVKHEIGELSEFGSFSSPVQTEILLTLIAAESNIWIQSIDQFKQPGHQDIDLKLYQASLVVDFPKGFLDWYLRRVNDFYQFFGTNAKEDPSHLSIWRFEVEEGESILNELDPGVEMRSLIYSIGVNLFDPVMRSARQLRAVGAALKSLALKVPATSIGADDLDEWLSGEFFGGDL